MYDLSKRIIDVLRDKTIAKGSDEQIQERLLYRKQNDWARYVKLRKLQRHQPPGWSKSMINTVKEKQQSIDILETDYPRHQPHLNGDTNAF